MSRPFRSAGPADEPSSASAEQSAPLSASELAHRTPVIPGTRWSGVWSWKWLVLLAAIVVAAATFVVSGLIPKRFSASALIRVTLPSTTAISEQSVQAENDLATQYAQIAASSPIVERAQRHLGASGVGLLGDASASTVGSQNLVQITARASSATAAQARANALASAFTVYINHVNAVDVARGNASADGPIRRTQERLQSTQLEVDRSLTTREEGRPLTASERAHLSALEAEVASLQGIQQSLILGQDKQGAASVRVFSPADAGGQTQPRPTLYAIVAFLVALLLSAQIAAVAGPRRSL